MSKDNDKIERTCFTIFTALVFRDTYEASKHI
jgi:hypothetical protein